MKCEHKIDAVIDCVLEAVKGRFCKRHAKPASRTLEAAGFYVEDGYPGWVLLPMAPTFYCHRCACVRAYTPEVHDVDYEHEGYTIAGTCETCGTRRAHVGRWIRKPKGEAVRLPLAPFGDEALPLVLDLSGYALLPIVV